MEFVDYILKFLTDIYKPHRALDVGAGELQQSIQMSKDGILVDAIEPNIKAGTSISDGINLIQTSAQDYKYLDNTYNLIIFRMVAQRLLSDDVSKLLSIKFPGSLAPKGFVYFMIPSSYKIPVDLKKYYQIRGTFEFDIDTSDFKKIKLYLLQKK